MTVNDELLAELLEKPVGPQMPRKASSPDDVTQELEVRGDSLTATVSGAAGEVTEGTARDFIASEGLDPAEWEISTWKKGKYGKTWVDEDGNRQWAMETIRFTFKRRQEGASEAPNLVDDAVRSLESYQPVYGRSGGSHGFLVLIGDMQFGKGLASETPILTTDGWTTHGELRVGMEVFGADGQPKRVLDVLPTTRRALYEVELGDGSVIVCDEDHLWSGSRKVRADGKWVAQSMTIPLTRLAEITAQESSSERPFVVDPSMPVQLPEADLLVEPHLLGLWLGDGSSATGSIALGAEDRHLISGLGVEIPSNAHGGSMFSVRVPGLTAKLRRLGVLGNKHVPEEYLYGSVEQRLALVCGLMDTDGHAATTGMCEFTNTNRQIIDSMAFLLRSLGMRPRISKHVGKLNGVEKKTYWRMTFRATMPVFTLPRKLARVKDATQRKHMRRSVVDVRRIKDGEAQCITVEGGLYLAGRELVVTHNCDGDGPAGTLARTIDCLNRAADALEMYRKVMDIGHVHIAWLGDHVEGFVSQGGANVWRTTLTLNEQIRLTHAVMLHALKLFAPKAEKVSMVAVPGNHGEPVRFEGKGTTRYDDSHDTEALISIANTIKALEVPGFEHVKFYVPDTDELTVRCEVAGTRVLHTHGHKFGTKKDAHMEWWKGQEFGTDQLPSHLLVAGHLHHEFQTENFIQVPAMESESTWWRHLKGGRSRPGLTVAITKDGDTPIKHTIYGQRPEK